MAPCSFSWSWLLGWQHGFWLASLIGQRRMSCLLLWPDVRRLMGTRGAFGLTLVPDPATTALAEQRRASTAVRRMHGSKWSDRYASCLPGLDAFLVRGPISNTAQPVVSADADQLVLSCTLCIWQYLIRLGVSYHFQLYHTCWFMTPYCRFLFTAHQWALLNNFFHSFSFSLFIPQVTTVPSF